MQSQYTKSLRPTQAADFHQRVAEDRRAWETVLKNVDLKGN